MVEVVLAGITLAVLADDFFASLRAGVVVVLTEVWLDDAKVILHCWIRLLVTSLSRPLPRLSGTGLAKTGIAHKAAVAIRRRRAARCVFMFCEVDWVRRLRFGIGAFKIGDLGRNGRVVELISGRFLLRSRDESA